MPESASTRLGLIAPSATDAIAIGDDQIRAIVAQLELVGAGFEQGTSRPAAAPALKGYLYVHTGTGLVSYCTGSAWIDLAGTAAPSWTNVTFLNSWTGGGVGLADSKDSLGIVRLRGRASHPSGSVSKVTTLPAGHRPVVVDQAWSVPLGFSDAFPTTPAGYGWCRVATTGDVTVLDEAGNSIGDKVAYLDAVSFPTW